MKGFVYSIFAIVLTLVIFAAVGSVQSVVKASDARYERLQRQEVQTGFVDHIETWHDNESGNEFSCVQSYAEYGGIYSISCFPTGRNWKN